jgi:N-acetylmuramoyl-L-alanine amidase
MAALAAVAILALGIWGITAVASAAMGGKPAAKVASVIPTASVPVSDTASVVGSDTATSIDAPTSTVDESVATPTAPVVPPAAPKKTAAPKSTTTTPAKVKSGFVVVIDAGHQGKGDMRLEPIGPGSKTKKPAVADGTAGVVTHLRESVINLRVALKLRTALQADGIKVIMIRTSENVDIANSQRAQIANKAHANLFIRLHCDGVNSSSVNGFLTLVPARNQWTGPIVSTSARAGRDIHKATLATTGAHDRGITPRGDMSGFNWSQVPSVIVEMGVMTNSSDDRKLASTSYEQKLASGIANGIVAFAAGK